MGMSPKLLRPRVSGFNPKSIAGLALWLDPTDASTYTISTGVSEWRDKSGNGKSFTQSTGNNQPTLSTINGKTAFSFDGVNDSLTTTGAVFTGNVSFAFFQVVQGTFIGTNGNTFNHRTATGGADTNDFAIGWRADQGSAWLFGTLRTRVTSTRSGSTYNADQRFDSVDVSGVGAISAQGSFNTLSATNTSYWKGAASPTANGAASPGTNAGMTLGCRSNTPNDLFYTGLMGDVIAYNRALTAKELAQVHSYLAKKWGYTTA